MNKICFVNYCTDLQGGTKWANRNITQTEQAWKHGSSEVRNWNSDMIRDTSLYKMNEELFTDSYYVGGTLWRPYIILRSMFETDCEIILYFDCDLGIVKDLHKFTDYLDEQDIVIPESPWLHGQFFRREAAILMGADTKEYYNMQQLYGGLMAFRNNDVSRRYLLDLLTATSYPQMSTAYSGNPAIPEYPNFHSHRNQGIITILYHQYGFKPYPTELIDVTDLREQGGATTISYTVEKR